MFKRSVFAAVAVLGMVAQAGAADFKPAIIFDMGGKFDKSFNEAAYNGAEAFKESSGVDYLEFEVTNESQRAQALARMAGRGADVVVAVGFAFASALDEIAPKYPDTKFTLIDMVVDQPNVQSVVFKEHEGSFLVGLAAAMTSASGKVGFVGGMDIPLIRKFALGYKEGAMHANSDVEVFENMTGNTPAAWNDPTKGGELARSQFDRGADVVYAAAGATGLGVLQAAADAGKYSIGVDSNQNYLHPGSVLTSMIKRVDLAVANAFSSAMDESWKPGFQALGLAEGGVDFALDEHNEALISDEVKAAVAAAKAEIIAGDIVVTDYMAQ